MNRSLIIIKEETPHDYYDISKITSQAFGQPDESLLIEKLRQGDTYIKELSLVAKYKGINIGHIMFTKIRIAQHSNILALAPMAVHPEFQGKGVGGLLIEAGIEIAKSLAYDMIVVLGHPSYYPMFGFTKASAYGISCPFEVPDEAFMILPLKAIEHIKGEVIYPEVFLEV